MATHFALVCLGCVQDLFFFFFLGSEGGRGGYCIAYLESPGLKFIKSNIQY